MLLATKSRPICEILRPLCPGYPRRNYADSELSAQNIETVNLAYASYESTNSVEGNIPSPLIINHGLFGSKANWNSLAKSFHQKTIPKRKIIAVDLRNHGDSPHINTHTYRHLAEDIKVLLNTLNIQKASLLGHSMGGRAVMMLALKYPELVDKLIVADVSPVTSSQSLRDTGEICKLLLQLQMPKQGPISVARANLDKQLSKKIQSKVLRGFLLTNLIQKSDGSFAWRVNLPVLTANYREEIEKFPKFNFVTFRGPTLFIGGEKSDFLPKSDQAEIMKIFPYAEFEYVKGVTHWLNNDKPNDFLRICVEFLNRPH